VIAATIHILRPHAAVATCDLDSLEQELARFDPWLVICSLPKPASSCGVVAWVEVPIDLGKPGTVCIRRRCSERSNVTLETLLTTIDEVERLIQTK
jgi:hypothetical protein